MDTNLKQPSAKLEKGTDYFSASSYDDIFDTTERPFGGFSLRQIVSFAVAGTLALGIGMFCVNILGLKMSQAQYPVMLICTPILAQAFVKPEGLDPFVWLRLWLQTMTCPQKLVYKSDFVRLSDTYPDIRKELAKEIYDGN